MLGKWEEILFQECVHFMTYFHFQNVHLGMKANGNLCHLKFASLVTGAALSGYDLGLGS